MNPFRNYNFYDVLQHNARIAARVAGKAASGDGDGVEVESKLHHDIIRECKRRGFFFVRSRMDMATTTAKGTPDFIVAIGGGRTLWVEAKTAKSKLTPEQAGNLHWLDNLGHRTAVVRSLKDFLEAIP